MREGPGGARRRPCPGWLTAGLVVLALTIGLSDTSSPPERNQFLGDEATYYMMTTSLVRDHDLAYEREDLMRAFEAGYWGGPNGVFLTLHPDPARRGASGGRQMRYGKNLLYPAFVAPWWAVFGDRGFLLFNGVLLAAMVAAGAWWLADSGDEGPALVASATFFFASAFWVYGFWRTPEIFNGALLFFAALCWFVGVDGARCSRARGTFLLGLSAVLFGLASYAKLSHVALAAPLFLHLSIRGRWRTLALCVVLFLVTTGGLFGATAALNGSWNFMGGERKTFVFHFPLEGPGATFARLGTDMSTNVETFRPPFSPALLARNLRDFFIGRYAGALVYLLPGTLALLAGLAYRLRRRDVEAPATWLGLAAVGLCLTYLVLVPENWLGGGGALGNRYLTNAYPILLFLVPRSWTAGRRGAARTDPEGGPLRGGALWRVVPLVWVAAGLFLGSVFAHPIKSSLEPDAHIDGWPHSALPLELSLLTNLPFNIHKTHHRVPVGSPPKAYLYFADHGAYAFEPSLSGFWVRGTLKADVVLRVVSESTGRLHMRLGHSPKPNEVTVDFEGERHDVLVRPGRQVSLEFPLDGGFPWRGTRLFTFRVRSRSAFIPKLSNMGSADTRDLGIFVQLELD